MQKMRSVHAIPSNAEFMVPFVIEGNLSLMCAYIVVDGRLVDSGVFRLLLALLMIRLR